MLKRKLLYTAITRAKEKLILIGDLGSFKYGVERTESLRQSVLKQKIIDRVLSKDNILAQKDTTSRRIKINNPNIPFEYLGEDLNSVLTPYDFMDK